MSLELAIAVLNSLADNLEREYLSIRAFDQELLGHAQVFEAVADDFLQQTWDVHHTIAQSVEAGQETFIDTRAIVIWLRGWTARLPTHRV